MTSKKLFTLRAIGGADRNLNDGQPLEKGHVYEVPNERAEQMIKAGQARIATDIEVAQLKAEEKGSKVGAKQAEKAIKESEKATKEAEALKEKETKAEDKAKAATDKIARSP